VGTDTARQLTEACQPIGTVTAQQLGFVDEAFGATLAEFEGEVEARARALAGSADYAARLATKQQQREADERAKPLAHYRDEELARMWSNFFGPDLSYHEARRRFVHKLCAPSPISLPVRRARLQLGQAA
jgi:putative two-component system hydrogenase maturation factor HypX/HoxX